MEKRALRRAMAEKRAALPAALREEAARACLERLLKLPAFLQAKTLFCYASYGSELPTELIAAAHPRVAYPKVMAEGEMKFYQGGQLVPGYRGIPEPQGGEEVLPQPGDLMLLPGLAFSLEGYRLGYGKGFYDRYLATVPCKPICCGLCFEEQIMDKIPYNGYDYQWDVLISPNQTYENMNKE